MTFRKEFKLQCELTGHSKDVRCLHYAKIGKSPSLISCSRDLSSRVWQETLNDKNRPELQEKLCLKGHEKFLTAVTYMAPYESFKNGIIFSASLDKTIRAYDGLSGQLLYKMEDHAEQVTCLDVDDSRHLLVSGSTNGSVCIWRDRTLVQTCTGHTAIAWAVLVVGQAHGEASEMSPGCQVPFVLSASADKTIILWSNGKSVRTFTGHTDAVRCLAEIDDVQFLSASNDATIRCWNRLNGTCVRVYQANDFIYSISLHPNYPYFATGGEDKAIKIWDIEKTECVDTILLPAQSIWSVVIMENGDVACGSSDGVVRIFTADPGRQADPDRLATFDLSVQQFHHVANIGDTIGDVKVSDLPGPEALLHDGVRDEQTKMVRVGDKVELHSWSERDRRWQKIGDILGENKTQQQAANQETSKNIFEGKTYDYVFDVDIEDGKPPLKLAYNLSQDPWHAAQEFIHKNFLPQAYLETVADFIVKNAKPVSGSVAASTVAQADYVDPFTGASRYRPAQNGSSSNAPSDSSKIDIKRPKGDDMPLNDYIRFSSCSAKLLTKLTENNRIVNVSVQLTEEHLSSLQCLVSDNKNYDDQDTGVIIEALSRLMQWDTTVLAPAIDLLRLALLNSHIFGHFSGSDQAFEQLIHQMCHIVSADGAPLGNRVFGCRAVANMLAMGAWHSIARDTILATELCNNISKFCMFTEPVLQISAVACFANAAYSCMKSKDDEASKIQLATFLFDFFKQNFSKIDQLDQQTLFYLLQTFITLLWDDDALILIANQSGCKELAQKLKDIVQEDKHKILARSLETMLY